MGTVLGLYSCEETPFHARFRLSMANSSRELEWSGHALLRYSCERLHSGKHASKSLPQIELTYEYNELCFLGSRPLV